MSTTANSSTKSIKRSGRNGTQPSEQAVAPRSVTQRGMKSYSAEARAKCMFYLLMALSQEMISKDCWALAMSAAQKRAEEVGVEEHAKIFEDLARVILHSRGSSFTGALDRAGFF